MSEERDTRKVYAALFVVQKELYAKDGYLAKSATNPLYKNKYIPLPKLLNHIVPMLHKQGCILLQKNQPSLVEGGANILTVVYHVESGQYITSNCTPPPMRQTEYQDKAKTIKIHSTTPQSLGGAITYARRYDLESLFAIPTEDDDGNAASGVSDKKKPAVTAQPNPFDYMVKGSGLPMDVVRTVLENVGIKTEQQLRDFTSTKALAVLADYKKVKENK